MRRRREGLCAAGALALLLAPCAWAEPPKGSADGAEPDAEAADVLVFGRGEAKLGVATAASGGTVAGSDLLVRPLLRVAELLEAVPGLVAAQHSGSGKANQYFLRGFNLDHGSDFTTFVDGVQMNLRTHGHGQGYLDLNGLIPEIVAREDFRKGPYRADGGDFALADAAYMTTIDRVERPWLSAEGGSYGYRRLAAGGTVEDVGGGALTLVARRSATTAHGESRSGCATMPASPNTRGRWAQARSRPRSTPIARHGGRPSRSRSGSSDRRCAPTSSARPILSPGARRRG